MRRLSYGFLTSVLLVSLAIFAGVQAQDPPPSPLTVENPADATGFVTVKFKLAKGDDVLWRVLPKPTRQNVHTQFRTILGTDGKVVGYEPDFTVLTINGPAGTTYVAEADWVNWGAQTRGRPTVEFTIGKLPIPPPKPVPPGPEPTPPVPPEPKPDPKPQPVTSFYVFVVYDTTPGKTTPVQNAVIFGRELEFAMNVSTTTTTGAARPGFGWRRFDPNTEPGLLGADIKGAWTEARASIQENNSKPPLLVCVPNKTIHINPLPATGKEAAALVMKHRGP